MIIKCPECGHQVSDKAPVCPSCGVEIAGKIIRCPNCGEIHFISDGICPNCHHSLRPSAGDNGKESASATTDSTEDTLSEEESIAQEEHHFNKENRTDSVSDNDDDEPVQAVPLTSTSTIATSTPIDDESGELSGKPSHYEDKSTPSTKPSGKDAKHSRWPLILSLIIAAIICLGLLFAYNNANQSNEAREYQQAIESRNPAILQSYLDTYTNAPTAHRDSVQALLNAIRASDPEWAKVKASNDVNVLKEYLQKNPNSAHKQEVLNKIDELDWDAALRTHDFANYLSLHQNGIHATEAVDSVKLTMDMPASGADKQKAVSAVRSFLVAINSHNSDRVRNCFATHLDYFNEKSSVDNNEPINYMALVYRDAERLNWHVDNADAAKVTKTGSGASAQYSITLPARLSVNYTSGNNVQARYNIQAKINGSGLITAIKMIKQAEEKPAETKSTSSEKKSSSTEKKSTTSEKKSSSEKSKSSEKKTSKSKK